MQAQAVLSLGAGVQSSTLALVAAKGMLDRTPVAAIFADTGWEPRAVYEWLDYLEAQLPFPVHRVTKGNIREDLLRSSMRGTHAEGSRCISPPLFTVNEDGSQGMVRRQCTEEYKLKPLRKKQRELMGLKKGARHQGEKLEVWIGISRDEAHRMKPSRDGWAVNRFPLIELGWSRADCLRWLEANGYPRPPRSACIGCPFRSDKEWLSLTDEEFEDACQVDDSLRNGAGYGRHRDMRGTVYLHAERRPLRVVSLNVQRNQQDLWGNECEGMCGV